jgi:hypothetical protein
MYLALHTDVASLNMDTGRYREESPMDSAHPLYLHLHLMAKSVKRLTPRKFSRWERKLTPISTCQDHVCLRSVRGTIANRPGKPRLKQVL